MPTGAAPWLAALVMALMVGCERPKATLSGHVRYEGKSLTAGYLTVFPEGQESSSRGVEIREGQYELDRLPTGRVKVLISTPSRAEPSPGTKAGLKIVPQTIVAADAIGNQQFIELRPGPQSRDFDLTKPPVVPGKVKLPR